MKFVHIRIIFLLFVFSILPAASAKTFWNQQAVLQPDAISAGFGEAVDISGDYIIIGAPQDYRDSQPKGAAYIYQRIGDDWIEQVKLTASDDQSGDQFGCAVAIDGDFAVIGAYGDDDMADSAGAVYIFRQIGGIWQQQTKLYAGDAKERYRFGVSVSISGSTIAVGAPISAFEGGTEGDPCGIDDRGEVYVFDFDGSSWSQQAKLLPDGSGRRFGKSVSIDNDSLAVAYSDNNWIYLFERTGATWNQLQKLDIDQSSCTNSQICLDTGRLITDGCLDSGGQTIGAAFIYESTGTQWQQTDLLLARKSEDICFGQSVWIDGNIAVAGAFNCYLNEYGSVVYIFEKQSSGWQVIDRVAAKDEKPWTNIGSSVCIDNGTVVSGSGSTVQKVYTFEEAATPPLPYDNFNDNDQSTLWYKYAENSNNCWIEEANERLELHSTTSASHKTAMYISNQWKLDTNYDFALKTEFYHNNSDSLHSWLMVMMTPDLANADTQRFHIGAGSYMGQDYYDYKVIDGTNITDDQIARIGAAEGFIYISYESGLDELYLSFTGYGSANAQWTIPNLLQGQWSGSPLYVAAGGGAESVQLDSAGNVYLDNFQIDSGELLDWPAIGDLDHDGDSDLADLDKFAQNWLLFDCGMCSGADMNLDQDVDMLDFAGFARNWLK